MALKFRSFDYDPQAGQLTIRMPSAVHDFFKTFLADEISRSTPGRCQQRGYGW
jgi:hypothetical protein